MLHSTALLVLLAVLATARLTTLVNDDYLLAPLRAAVDDTARRDPANRAGRRRFDSVWSWLAYLLHCPWCVSMWAGLAVSVIVYNWHEYAVVQVALIGLAASYVTGLLAETRTLIEAVADRIDTP